MNKEYKRKDQAIEIKMWRKVFRGSHEEKPYVCRGFFSL